MLNVGVRGSSPRVGFTNGLQVGWVWLAGCGDQSDPVAGALFGDSLEVLGVVSGTLMTLTWP
jgi:hypothetical protein